ncbi:hypothetical protein FO519_007436 [Halicephalobus sp. NKZ332]|nr:hypothetical protein FO519_007436 [Halicephalobus sp. NKZ332]
MMGSEATIVSTRHYRPRGIVSSIVATGLARLVINEERGVFAAGLYADDENFGIHGVFDKDSEGPSTSLASVSVTDGYTGDQYRVLNVPVEFFSFSNPVTKAVYKYVRFNHPAVKFETKELLIGDRAEIEIQQQLGAQVEREVELTKPIVHLGQMSLKIVTSQKIEPGFRRESLCERSPLPILEQSEDFLV